MSQLVCGPTRIVAHPEEVGSISGGFSLNGPAWTVIDWSPMLNVAIRGQDLLIPGADGVVARDRYIDVLPVNLQMVFDGNENQNGVTNTGTLAAGLEANRQTFIAGAVNPPAAPATRTLSLTLADGDVVTGAFHCVGFEWQQRGDGIALAVWRISLPDGPLS